MKIEVNCRPPSKPDFVDGKVYKRVNGNDYYLCTGAVVFGSLRPRRLVNLSTGACWSMVDSGVDSSDPSNGDAHKFVLVENIKVVVG